MSLPRLTVIQQLCGQARRSLYQSTTDVSRSRKATFTQLAEPRSAATCAAKRHWNTESVWPNHGVTPQISLTPRERETPFNFTPAWVGQFRKILLPAQATFLQSALVPAAATCARHREQLNA